MPPVANCPSCGARVDAPPGAAAYVHTCRFCGAQIPIEPLVAPLPPTPPGIPQIVRASFEVQREMSPELARGVKVAAGGVGCVVIGSVLLPFLIIAAVFLGPMIWGSVSGRYGSFPMSVPLNGSLEIDDRTATGTDTMITMGTNGKLTLRRCHLKGPLIVKAQVNGEVTIIDSTLDGQTGVIEGDTNLIVTIQNSTITSGEEIVDAPVNAKIAISKDSKLTAAGVAFPLEGSAEIAIDHSTVEGKLGGIALKVNGHVKMTNGALVTSDGPAIELPLNGHLAITSSRVESKTEAILAENNVEGTLRSSVLVGPKAALDIGPNGKLTLSQVTVNGPKKVAAYAKVDER